MHLFSLIPFETFASYSKYLTVFQNQSKVHVINFCFLQKYDQSSLGIHITTKIQPFNNFPLYSKIIHSFHLSQLIGRDLFTPCRFLPSLMLSFQLLLAILTKPFLSFKVKPPALNFHCSRQVEVARQVDRYVWRQTDIERYGCSLLQV